MSSTRKNMDSQATLDFRASKSTRAPRVSLKKGGVEKTSVQNPPQVVLIESEDDKEVQRKKRPREPENEIFLPRSIFKTVIYTSSKDDQKEVDRQNTAYGVNAKEEFMAHKHKRKVLDFVLKHFDIPKNFETSNQFGAHSGTCYQDRVLINYMAGKLALRGEIETKGNIPENMKMCYECGELGHFPDNCETVFES